jgi:hypothetical protein
MAPEDLADRSCSNYQDVHLASPQQTPAIAAEVMIISVYAVA